jgi:hypothetical protein
MKKKYDITWDQINVFALLNIPLAPKAKTQQKWVAHICPFCGNVRFDINEQEQLYSCKYCQEHGTAAVLWGKLKGIDGGYKEIWKDIFETYENDVSRFTPPEAIKIKVKEQKTLLNATEIQRDTVNRRFLSELSLSEDHYNNLKRRGFKDSSIKNYLYKSVPSITEVRKVIAKMEKEGYDFSGVSGFYKENGTTKAMVAKGFFVPLVNERGLITGMQIRLDKKFKKMNYIAFSKTTDSQGNDFEEAAEWVAKLHVNTGINKKKLLFITEGPLKANALSILGYPVIGLLGVNGRSTIVGTIRNLGLDPDTKIYIIFDQDANVNIQVKKAAINLWKLLSTEITRDVFYGIPNYEYQLKWENAFREDLEAQKEKPFHRKGIDDFLLSLSLAEINMLIQSIDNH